MSVNNPTLSTTPDQTSVTLGPPVTLKDTADLEGGFNPKGSITFTLVGPDGTTDVDTEMVTVNPDSPTLSTIPDRTSVTLGPPVTLHDAAFLQGGFNPRGASPLRWSGR